MSTFRGRSSVLTETGRMAGESLERWLRDFDGYRGILILTDEASETARVLTFWETEQDIERSGEARRRMRDQMAAHVGMTVEGPETYEIAFWDPVPPAESG